MKTMLKKKNVDTITDSFPTEAIQRWFEWWNQRWDKWIATQEEYLKDSTSILM